MPSARPLLPSIALGTLAACGGGGGGGRDDDASASGISLTGATATEGTGTESGATEATDDGVVDTTAGECTAECEGVCIGDLCCAAESACGEVCCPQGDVCSFQQCATPGIECLDASECEDDEYCEYSLGEPGQGGGMGMCQGGEELATGKCLPKPPECPPGVEPEGEEIDCLPVCEVIPVGGFEPTVKYHWQGGDSMMAPMVIQLDDDNCDKIVDERDIPEIVFATFAAGAYTTNGTLHAISIVDGAIVDKWAVNPQAPQMNPGLSIATGNIDGTPGNEVVVCTVDGRAMAFDHDGTQLWVSGGTANGCFMPSIADFDQDGVPEVLTEAAIYDGLTGAQEMTFAWQQTTSAADMDGDGQLEVVGPRYIFEADGTMLADSGVDGYQHAIADFDGDGSPEVAAINRPAHTLYIWRLVPGVGVETVRTGIDINNGLPPCNGGDGGGPPTIADFDGDGTPDVGVAAGVGYTVFGGAQLMNAAIANPDTVLWLTPAVDCSSRATGSSVFDFDGDGAAEAVYGDEQYLRIYDGATGTVLFETCNTTGTLWEYPIITDVDSDGHADIIAISNSYSSITCPLDGSKQSGVRVFGDLEGRWVRTRRVWNQHHYHVTNVDEDGNIPTAEQPNWNVEGLNNFRQNVQPQGEFSAPDLVVSVLAECSPESYALVARVRNIGQAAVPAGVVVGFYEGDPAAGGVSIGTGMTTKALYPAEAEDVVLALDPPPAGLVEGTAEAWVVVDDGMPEHVWEECRPDNNSAHGPVPCQIAG